MEKTEKDFLKWIREANWAWKFCIQKKQKKTKSLKSRERGELKLKRSMMIKVDWWLKLFDD